MNFGKNVVAIFLVLYFFSGVSILHFLFKKFKTKTFGKILGYFLVFLQPTFFIGIGIIDVWFDLRKFIIKLSIPKVPK